MTAAATKPWPSGVRVSADEAVGAGGAAGGKPRRIEACSPAGKVAGMHRPSVGTLAKPIDP